MLGAAAVGWRHDAAAAAASAVLGEPGALGVGVCARQRRQQRTQLLHTHRVTGSAHPAHAVKPCRLLQPFILTSQTPHPQFGVSPPALLPAWLAAQ